MKFTSLALSSALLASALAAVSATSLEEQKNVLELIEAKRSNNSNRRTLSKKAPRGLRSLQKKRSDGKGKDDGKGKSAPVEPVDPAICEIAVSTRSNTVHLVIIFIIEHFFVMFLT
jgi:hypothetical protein